MLDIPMMPGRTTRAAAAGCGVLRVVCRGGRSVAEQVYATSPLRLLTPRNHGRAAWVYTSTYGGGLVDGDRLRLDVEVGAGATAFVSTQASTKVYRSPGGTAADLHVRVLPGGLAVVLPDPVVCFKGARYHQRQEFDVAAGSGLVLVDWITSGRRASGEQWAFSQLRSESIVRVGDRVMVHDALALRAVDGELSRRLGRFHVLATVVVAGAMLHTYAASIVAAANADRVSTRADQLVAATPVADMGCVLRLAGTSHERVAETVRTHLAFVPNLLGDSPWSRKW
jgi:urease accessory protein